MTASILQARFQGVYRYLLPDTLNRQQLQLRFHQSFRFPQNYPNPFNPTTTITYNLDQPGMVNLVIYDLLGRKVDTLVDEMKSPGYYAVKWNAEGFASECISTGLMLVGLRC